MVEETLSKQPINHTTLAASLDSTGGQYWRTILETGDWRLETGGQYSILNTGEQYWRTVGQWTVLEDWRTVLEDSTGY